MGELGALLGRMLRLLLVRALGRSPFFIAHEWTILAGALSVPLAWFTYHEFKTRMPAKPLARIKQISPGIRAQNLHWQGKAIEVLTRFALPMPSITRFPVALSLLGLLVAVSANMPYDYYLLLRVLVCLTCVMGAVALWKSEFREAWFWGLVALAVIYNPLVPLRLHRETWEWINIMSVPVFAVLFLLLRPKRVV